MEVKIKNLKPNPYRDLDNYPINREKVETLKASIKQTGFWDNILARLHSDTILIGYDGEGEPVGTFDSNYKIINTLQGGIPVSYEIDEDSKKEGYVEIAYGHHRLIALRELLKPDNIVDIPVKNLPDSVMIQVMANENMDEWKTTASVIDETVRVAKEFLEQHPEEIVNLSQDKIRKHTEVNQRIVSEFLGWNETRVRYSLDRLKAIDDEIITKEIIKEMPTERHAREFTSAMRKEPKESRMSHKEQLRFARGIKEADEKVPSREIYSKLLDEKYKPKKKDTKEVLAEKERKQKIIKIETLLRSNLYASRDMIDELSNLLRIKEEFGEEIIVEDKALSIQVTANFQRLYELLSNILKINKNE